MIALFLCVFLVSCADVGNMHHDSTISKKKSDFYQLLNPPGEAEEKTRYMPPPKQEKQWPAAFSQVLSFSLSGTVPVQDALTQLALKTQFSLIFQGYIPPITLSYKAHNQSFKTILDNICDAGGLRYRYEKDTLIITADTPHIKTHNIQFLLGFRTTKTQTSVKTDILSNTLHGGEKNATDNGSTMVLDTGHTVDFWDELEKNLILILNDTPKKTRFSLNRYAGMVSVFGTEKQHRMVAKYLAHLQKLVTTQILIEAKIMEIDLHDEYKSGINWTFFFEKNVEKTQEISHTPTASLKEGQFSFSVNNSHLHTLVNFIEHFGTVRTLANPRQAVLNNQAAILKVAHNEVFFELQIQDEESRKGRQFVRQRAQSRVQTVPIGLILYVHPSLNAETGDIIVSLHPTISRVLGTKEDPAVALYDTHPRGHKPHSEVPIVQVREMDSVIVAREGQVIVTGGLMEERCSQKTHGLPLLKDLPFIGNFFQNKEKKRTMTELVILLKLSVINPHQSISLTDQRIGEEFMMDPRPLDMH